MYQRLSFPDTGRGGFAPRRGRGGQNRYPNHKRKEAEGLDIEKHPLGELLKSFSGTDLEQLLDDTFDAPQIEDCKYITSYNWTASSKATIIVPGKPPRWTPLTEPQRLKEDTGSYFRDPNAARSPDYPTAPAVCTILNQDPTFPTCDVDIFACGSTLGNLLRFVRSVDRAFRFNVERIGNTVFFVRKENDPRELIKGVHGYGHTFPEAYITWGKDFKGSEDNQRIVQYKFSDLNCIVRFECDGYIEEHDRQQPDTTFKKDDLLEDLEATSVSPAAPHSEAAENNYHGLSIKTGGAAKVPQSSIFDLKTRSNRYGREINMSDIIPTLWIKQVPNFIIAYHDGRGLFENKNIKVQDVRADVRKWEQDNKQAIQRLSVLLWKIVEIARTNNRGLLEVCRSSVNCIEIRDQYGEGVHALPASLMEEWTSERNNDIALGKEDDIDQPEKHSAPFFAENWEDDDKDYTACSTDCAYCGKCTY